MADNGQSDSQVQLNTTRMLSGLLAYGGGGLLALFTLAWAVARLWVLTHAAVAPPLSDYLAVLTLLFVGLTYALLLWAVGEIVRQLDAVRESIVQLPGAQAAASAAAAPAPAEAERSAIRELVAVLREVRDVSLLNDAQRAQRLEIQGRDMLHKLEQEVPALLREHNWVDAARRVQAARERFPSTTGWDALQAQIDRMRASVEAHDVDTATRQVNDLVALGAWERATEVVHDLLHRHPAAARAQELARRLATERERAEADQRARLLAQAQEATNTRDWHAALATAQTLIQKFPRSADAEILRQQLPVLRENAEIQTRQRMEHEIRELVKQQRFDAAIRVGREVLQRFPSSPQAHALREQLPRMEHKAIELGQRA